MLYDWCIFILDLPDRNTTISFPIMYLVQHPVAQTGSGLLTSNVTGYSSASKHQNAKGAPPSPADTQSQVPCQVITSYSSPAPTSCFSAFSFISTSILFSPCTHPIHLLSALFFQRLQCLLSPHLHFPSSALLQSCGPVLKTHSTKCSNQKLLTGFDATLACAWKHIAPVHWQQAVKRKKRTHCSLDAS